MKQSIREEVSAGGVVFRRNSENSGYQSFRDSDNQKIQFLIGKHGGYHKWVLPKGLVEKGESREQAAMREVEEEVGVRAKIVGVAPIKSIEYWYYADLDLTGKTTRRVSKYAEAGGAKSRIHKSVTFYLMEVEEDLGKEGWEMEERRWVSYEEGVALLAFETEKEVWQEAGMILKLRFGASAET